MDVGRRRHCLQGTRRPRKAGVAVGISTLSIAVAEILVLPVCWRPCRISGTDGRRSTSAVCPVDTSTRKSGCSRRNFDAICRSSGDTSTSGLLAAMLDFRERSRSGDIGSTAIRKFAPENMGVTVGISSLTARYLEICLGKFGPCD